jgi:hypothetical protein
VGSWKSSLCQTIKSVNDAYDYKNEKTAWQWFLNLCMYIFKIYPHI